jgi:predicted GH43/DUF377 family glycosyl hydrolase
VSVAFTGALALALALPGSAQACSKDDTAYFETFLDTSCLQAPLGSTTLDALGGLRLATNGTPTTATWDTDGDFANGITWESVPFQPVGVGTLQASGNGSPAALGLPATLLPLTRDSGNPVLKPPPSTSLDSDNVDDPSVAKVGSTFLMWYSATAEDGTGPAIFEATSLDGTAWTRANGGNPVLQGTQDAFDAKGVSGPDVIYNPSDSGAPYKMWYAGRGDVFGAIGYATSADGVSWTKHDDPATAAPADPVLEHGLAGSADSFAAADPSVMKDGATWKMWYTGDDSSKKRIAYATAPDGINWARGGKVISPEDPGANANYSFGAFAPTVWKTSGGGYRMLLTGRKLVSGTTMQTKVMDADSSDGITWTAPSPALNPSGTNSKFDFSNLNSPFVLHDPGAGASAFKLYYAGNTLDANGNFHTRIGLATSSNGTAFGKVTGSQTGGSVLDVGTLGTSLDARQASGLSVAAPAGATPRLVGFYSGVRGSDFTPRLGEATSTDGSTWTKVPVSAPNGGALFPLGNTFDQSGQRDPSILYDQNSGGGTDDYFLYFTALDGSTPSVGFSSTAENGGTKQSNNNSWSARTQVLAASGSGFDADGVSHPSVIEDSAGSFFMYYTGTGASGAQTIGRVTSTAAGGPFATRTQVLSAGSAGSFDAGGVKDPVVLKAGAGDYRMLYTGVEALPDGTKVERVGYATSTDGAAWTKRGAVLAPSQTPHADDETGVEPTGMLVDGTTLRVWSSGVDRTGRTRGDQLTTAYPTPASPASGIPNGWATYQLGGPATSVRDFRGITRASSGNVVTLWMSFLQPYSSAGNEFWSSFFPVTLSDSHEVLNFLLTVRGVRWQARLSDPASTPRLDRVDISHAPVSFFTSGAATTTDITPPSGQAIDAWGKLTVGTSLFQPNGGGGGGGTASVLDAASGATLASAALSTNGDTTIDLSGFSAAEHPALRARLELTGDGSVSPLVRSLKVLYNAAAQPPPPAAPPVLTLTSSTPAVVYGQRATLTGNLSRVGVPLASQTVSLLQQPAGPPAFAPLAGAATDAAGNYTSLVAPQKQTTYKATFAGVTSEPTVSLAVHQLVTLSVKRTGGEGYFKGRIAPGHPRRPVTIQLLQRGKWVAFAKLTSSSMSAFSAVKRLKPRVKYRFRAVTPADADHLNGTSAVAYVERMKVSLSVGLKGRTATFAGKVSPPHPGKTVVLKILRGTGLVTFAKARLSRRSSYRLVKKLTRGTHRFRALTLADRDHFGGSSLVRTVTVR